MIHFFLNDNTVKNNGFLILEIKNNSKIVRDCYNKRINIPCSTILLIEDTSYLMI